MAGRGSGVVALERIVEPPGEDHLSDDRWSEGGQRQRPIQAQLQPKLQMNRGGGGLHDGKEDTLRSIVGELSQHPVRRGRWARPLRVRRPHSSQWEPVPARRDFSTAPAGHF